MSEAAAAVAAPPNKGKKKLIIIIAAAALLVGVGGGAGVMLLTKKPPDAEAGDEEGADDAKPAKTAKTAAGKHDPKAVPTFVPLEPFTVNLADRDAERYAQVGITLEISDSHVGDRIKAFMPAIRNNILLAMADRTSVELMDREGKRTLAEKIRRETSRAMGFEVEDEPKAGADGEGGKAKAAKKGKEKKAKPAYPELPIAAVHFSNFIIQ
ncbi:MAG: flagellar basal body-associated FliL family protein [Burkholderiales bacterium]|jgi:flagellar FliL protein